MLIVLCSYCMNADKYFGKLNQGCVFHLLHNMCLALTPEDLAGTKATGEVMT